MDLEKAEEPEIKLPTSFGSLIKQDSSRKNINFYFIDYAKAFYYVDHNKICGSHTHKNSEGDQPWDFFGRNDGKAETPVLSPPHEKS